MNKKVIKILIGVIVFLMMVIFGLIWWFVLKPENTENKDSDIKALEKEALQYYNKHSDVYAAKMIMDYYKNNKDTTILKDEYEKAKIKYNNYYSENKDINIFFEFLKDDSVIKTQDQVDSMLGIWQVIIFRDDDIIYVFDDKTRQTLLKGYDLISKMDKDKSQKSFEDFINYYLGSNLSDYEIYGIYLYMSHWTPNLLADTEITFNNKKTAFSLFLENSGINNKYITAINNIYLKYKDE